MANLLLHALCPLPHTNDLHCTWALLASIRQPAHCVWWCPAARDGVRDPGDLHAVQHPQDCSLPVQVESP